MGAGSRGPVGAESQIAPAAGYFTGIPGRT
jgi:hypothetical protein